MSKETVHLGVTRFGYDIAADVHPDAIGFPVVERATATHPHTGVIRAVGEEHFPNIRNILMSKQIADGARQQADDALLPLTGMSERAIEAAVKYNSGGIEAHLQVHQAMGNMALSLEQEWRSNLDTLLHRIEKTLNGEEVARERRHDVAVTDVPQHGLGATGLGPTGDIGRG